MILQPTLACIDPAFDVELCDDNGEENEGDCEGLCNPFLSCDTCFGFTADSESEPNEIAKITKREYVEYSESPILDQIFEIFHPPCQA